ncbi:DUF6861 domain-containing protein [Pseudoduganella lutea]|uniref:NAD(+)--protein-arginine ADP-ribosyltransferase Tre1-like N-terminal domain-containing protein n=1 Tax=Pseudoduganella lutea TaxID=321985 RepID=A0A4V0Z3Y5_9BURK|nr:hypothetical protein [Pseudoduganella lutea]QBE65063.1 hypothetical protein EWM63_20420 [Pseudoduganella lutea]
MALNNKEEVHFWRELERVEQWLSTGAGAAAGRIYDTMGRPGEQTFANYGNELVASVARVERVRQALDQSGSMAKRLAMQQLSGIGLDDVWDILLAACKEIALYYGGAVVTGAVVGGAIGSLAFGAGAIPGAVVGGAAGSQVGIWVLTLLGLKELVVGLGTMFPAAMEHYVRGFREAWGTVPDNKSDFGNSAALSSGSISAGAWHMGQGHVILVTAILTAVVAYLTRGGGTTASLAQMARQSRQLGAKFANWAVKNEGRLLAHPQLQSRPNNSVAMAMEEVPPKSRHGASGANGSKEVKAAGANRPALSFEDALVVRGDASRAQIVQTIGDAAQPSLKEILRLDPNARVGFRGSLVDGLKNDTKRGVHGERVAFDGNVATKDGKPYTGPQGYDADFFVVSDDLAAQFSKKTFFKDITKLDASLKTTFNEFGTAMQRSSVLGGMKTEIPTFRVYSTAEMAKKTGSQYYFLTPGQ